MNKDTIFMVILMFSIVLGGCAGYMDTIAPGVVSEIQHGSTMLLVQDAIKGHVMTFIWHKPDTSLWLLGKVFSERGIAFINIDASVGSPLTLKYFVRATGGNANLVSGATFQDFLKFMRENGWRTATTLELARNAPKIINLSNIYDKLWWAKAPLLIIVTAPITIDELMLDPHYREVRVQ